MPNPRIPTGDQAPPRTAITVRELAAQLAISYEQALGMCSVHGGPIASFHVGRLIRIPVGAVADYVDQAVVQSPCAGGQRCCRC